MPPERLAIGVRRFDDIADWMMEGRTSDVPDVLSGIFYMDHVKLREECGTFDGLGWDAERRSVTVPVYAPLRWSYEHSASGRRLLRMHHFIRFTLEFRFADDAMRRAKIQPILFGFLRIPSWLLSFDMIRADGDENGNTWYRRNAAFFGLHAMSGYTLRRVIDRDGRPTPAYQRMLDDLPDSCLVNERVEGHG